MKINLSLLACLVTLGAPPAHAAVALNPVLSDHLVLQRDTPVAIWGTADPAEPVRVQFAGQVRTATADAHGRWRVELAPLSASATGRDLVVTGAHSSAEATDVLVGEVWLCSGQSNMEWALGRSDGGAAAIAASADPELRLCTLPHNCQTSPRDDVATKWVVSGPADTPHFSAVAWWFGRKLQRELHVPVGIINDSYGGTQIQCWMRAETLAHGPWPQDKSTNPALATADHERRVAAMQPAWEKYLTAKAAAQKAGAPAQPAGWPGEFRGPAMLWNGMVAPLLNFRVRGVAWYQGENNAYPHIADTYGALLPAMIADWRAGFRQPDLPFIVIQISGYRAPQTDPNEVSGMAQLREAQALTVQHTPHTALVVTLDLGTTNVHYTDKEPAADRTLAAALALAYGRPVTASGPTFDRCEIAGDRAIVHFNDCAGGLVAKGGAPTGFVIASADHRFVFADARIEGDHVIVTSPQVAHPVAVRYGWANLPKVNVYNRAGFPAAPFRTDAWSLSLSTPKS